MLNLIYNSFGILYKYQSVYENKTVLFMKFLTDL